MEIDALIPAYNEAALVGRTVTALFKLPQIKQVLVIDDGSTDGTAAVSYTHLERGSASLRNVIRPGISGYFQSYLLATASRLRPSRKR